MRTLIISLFSLLVFVSCSKKTPVEGKWQMNMAGIKNTIEYSGNEFTSISNNPYCSKIMGKFSIDEEKGTITINTLKSEGKRCPKNSKTTMKFEVKDDKLMFMQNGISQTYKRVD